MDIKKDLLNYGLNLNALVIVDLDREIKGIRFIEFGDDKKGSLVIPFASTEEYDNVINRITNFYTEKISNKLFVSKNLDDSVKNLNSFGEIADRLKNVFDLFYIFRRHVVIRDLNGKFTKDFEVLRYIFRVLFFRTKNLLKILHVEGNLTDTEHRVLSQYIIDKFREELK